MAVVTVVDAHCNGLSIAQFISQTAQAIRQDRGRVKKKIPPRADKEKPRKCGPKKKTF